ncbi:uncharacterized protein LOC125178887 [Hyalella azteca]|uniref:Uncharacterized protein LOC125178887 n=1 Tax=Hyalella azteca TaxID=294128 RepID=A0A979FRA0_HYAAZ|nr:uncharacterized protein LOC125178887 [Hyalella azteca]
MNPRRVLERLTGSRADPGGRPKLDQGNKFKLGGATSFHTFFSFVCSLSHVQKRQSEENLNFDPKLLNEIYFVYCNFIYDYVWGKSGFSLNTWFPELPEVSCQLVKMSRCSTEEKYEFKFSNGVSHSSVFDETSFLQSFYVDKKVFERVGQELCTALDVAVSMGGCEAVVESFYSVVDTQRKGSTMSNETLELQSIIDWCYPKPYRCPATMETVANLMLDGNFLLGITPSPPSVHMDTKNKSPFSEVSKVLQRLKNEPVKYAFLLHTDDFR